jgi:hypothetical protein
MINYKKIQDYIFNFNNVKIFIKKYVLIYTKINIKNVCSNHILLVNRIMNHTLLTLYMFNLPNTRLKAPS